MCSAPTPKNGVLTAHPHLKGEHLQDIVGKKDNRYGRNHADRH